MYKGAYLRQEPTHPKIVAEYSVKQSYQNFLHLDSDVGPQQN